jgi:hypothetical protein
MKSTARKSDEKFPNGVRGQEEAPYFINGTHASTTFESADQIRQTESAYCSSPLPSYFAFDTHLQDRLGRVEWSTAQHTTVRSTIQTSQHPISIYGTSSEYTVAEDLIYEPVLPSPISSIGTNDVLTPFNSSAMIWERFPASESTNPINTFSQPHTVSQEHCQGPDDEVYISEEDNFPVQLGPDPALMMNSRSSSSITTGEITESSTTSEYNTYGTPEMPPAKRARVSPPSPRWNTTRKTHKKKLEQNTITFPQSPTPFAPKTTHNAIEKQYRNRLNDKFEALLSVLPTKETEGRRRSLAKVSKGDVLVLAKDYIESLQTTRDELQMDRRSLEDDVKGLREACGKSGELGLP